MEAPSIEKIKAGDEAALKDLFTALLPRVRHMTSKYSAGMEPELIDDIVQETVVKIYSNIQKFHSEPQNFWLWCNAIARNVALDAIRTANSRSRRFQALEDTSSDDLPVVEPTVDASIDTAKFFKEALQLLSENDKHILTLSLQGYSFEEIARVSDRDITTLRVQYHRAVKKLQRLLLTRPEGSTEVTQK